MSYPFFGTNIYIILSVATAFIAVFGFLIATIKLKAFIQYSVKKGAQEAADEAVNNWQQLAKSQQGRMEEMTIRMNGLGKKIDELKAQNEEQKRQINELQKNIDGMHGVDEVGKMVVSLRDHLDAKFDTFATRQNVALDLIKNDKSIFDLKNSHENVQEMTKNSK